MITERSQEKELLDLGPTHYSQEEYTLCQKKLFRINRLLGIYQDTVKFLRKNSGVHSLLDIGCGSGLFLLHLSKQFPDIRLLGTDISPDAIRLANQELNIWQTTHQTRNVHFKIHNNQDLEQNTTDILLTTLVCHHMGDNELILFLQKAQKAARKAVIIHDLQRHLAAEYLYQFISPFFQNRLISHDGLISIQKGFTRSEWKLLLKAADITHYQLHWRCPFRWRLIIWNKSL